MGVDTSYLSELDLQTLADDIKYKQEIAENTPTVFFRPDDRTSEESPTYWRVNEEGLSYIGLIKEYGSHEEKRPPTFIEPRTPVVIVDRYTKRIDEVSKEEYEDAYNDLKDTESLCGWVQKKYSNKVITLSTIVTVYRIKYL